MREFLRTVPLFSGLADEEIDLLARTAEERRFPKGAHIVRAGEPGTSAFVLKDGTADTLLEKAGGTSVPLSKLSPGDVFGEIALFDGEPRSASVVTTDDATVIEINRALFLEEVAQCPELSLKLLAEMSKRLRRSESVVRDFSDRIYGDVLPRLESAVSAQLESAKTICEQSKERVRSISDMVESKWTTLTRVGIIAGGVLGMMAAFGIHNLDTARHKIEEQNKEDRQKLDQANKESKARYESERDSFVKRTEQTLANILAEKEKGWSVKFSEVETHLQEANILVNRLKKKQQDLMEDQRALEVIKENRVWMGRLWMDKLRRDLRIEDGAQILTSSDHELDQIARDFLAAQRRLLNTYFGAPESWDAEILIEAMELLAEIDKREYIELDDADWETVIDGIERALKHPPEHWRGQQRLAHQVAQIHGRLVERTKRDAMILKKRMLNLLEDQHLNRQSRRQTAVILADLGSNSPLVTETLRRETKGCDPWESTQAAVALISLDDNDSTGWDHIRKMLGGSILSNGNAEPVPTALTSTCTGTKLHIIDSDIVLPEALRPKEAGFAAAVRLAERSFKEEESLTPSFTPEILTDELDRAKLAEAIGVSPDHLTGGASGVELIADNITEGLTRDPTRFNAFYWRFACDLICDLGCKTPGTNDRESLCRQCFGEMAKHYSGIASKKERTAISCPKRTDASMAGH